MARIGQRKEDRHQNIIIIQPRHQLQSANTTKTILPGTCYSMNRCLSYNSNTTTTAATKTRSQPNVFSSTLVFFFFLLLLLLLFQTLLTVTLALCRPHRSHPLAHDDQQQCHHHHPRPPNKHHHHHRRLLSLDWGVC